MSFFTRLTQATLLASLPAILILAHTSTVLGQEPAATTESPEPPEATATPEPGEAVATEPTEPEPFDLRTADHLTGDWGGTRTWMEDHGITLELVSNSQMMVNMRGGLETKNGVDFGASYNLELNLDFDKMGLIPGADFTFEAKGTSGNEISDFDREKIGGLFRTNSDAKSEEPIYVDKWWWRQRLLEDRVEIWLGRIETEKDLFDVNSVAGHEDKQFMNQALVANPAISHQIGLGAFVKVRPVDWFYIQAAAIDPEGRDRRTGFDTAFHGEDRIKLFYELGVTPDFDSAKGKMPGKYLVGSWYNPQSQTVFHATGNGRWLRRSRSGDGGFYFGMEQFVWKENDSPSDKQGVSVFGRYGYARDDVNMIEHFWSTGAQYVGLIPDRDEDVLGFGIAQAILSDQYRDQIDSRADRETVCELYYACHVTPWCILSPDLQYIANAGGGKGDRHALVAGLRLRVHF